MNLVFVTNNPHKLLEIRHALPEKLSVSSLKDVNILEDIPETQDTIEGNAMQKAEYVFNTYGFNCFADDTGLEVMALDKRPGVYSSRYAGPECNASKNMAKLLKELEYCGNRLARFRTVIAYVEKDNIFTFEGIAEGSIAHKPAGNKGFGYDPVFIPLGHNRTFAQMTLKQKNTISHRARALNKFITFLNSRYL